MKANKTESRQNLIESSSDNPIFKNDLQCSGNAGQLDRPLGPIEKAYLLHADRGDVATVAR